MNTSEDMGSGQSPIDITDWVESDAPAPIFAYTDDAARIIEGPGPLTFSFQPVNHLLLGKESFQLLQFHWHTPAEHTLDGEEFAIEMHFVHANARMEHVVVGSVYRVGERDAELQQIIEAKRNAREWVGGHIWSTDLLAKDQVPESDGFYHYTGSLTTAPFSEPVQWYVGRSVRTISERQAEQLQVLSGGANARPLQDRNGRTIVCVGCGR